MIIGSNSPILKYSTLQPVLQVKNVKLRRAREITSIVMSLYKNIGFERIREKRITAEGSRETKAKQIQIHFRC